MIHVPVLVDEVLEYLSVRPGGAYIDATLNGGGHTRAILERIGETGMVLGIEYDPEIAAHIQQERIQGLIVENASYTDMKQIAHQHHMRHVDGILFDFGMSSWHVDASGRGFSFRKDEVLDMRFNPESGMTAAEVVNQYSASELEDIFRTYSEERRARAIAEAIVGERKKKRILTTKELSSIIERIVPRRGKHPATRVFQALRIAVNRELDAVSAGLDAACDLVAPGGRVVAIAFHSLEDRTVKRMMRARDDGRLVTKKAVRSSRTEYLANPRSRSAVLRAWEKHI